LEKRPGNVFLQVPKEFISKTRGRAFPDLFPMLEDSFVCFFFNRESDPAGVAEDPNHSNRVLEKSFVRITNCSDDAPFEVSHPAHIIDNREVSDIIKEAIDGEITAQAVLLGCSKTVRSNNIPILCLDFFKFRTTSKSGDLDDLSAFEKDVNKPESATDDAAVSKQGIDLVGMGIGGNIEILRESSDKKITDTSTNKIGQKPVTMESVENLQSLFIDPLSRNRMLGSGNDDGRHNVPL
jgi:hypothetical protein